MEKNKEQDTQEKKNSVSKVFEEVNRFVRRNISICVVSLIAFVIVLFYYLTYDKPEVKPGINKWLELAVTFSIGVLTNLIFFVFQVYIPQIKREKNAKMLIQSKLDDLFLKLSNLIFILETTFDFRKDDHVEIKENLIYYKWGRKDRSLILEKETISDFFSSFETTRNVAEDIVGDFYFKDCSEELISLILGIQNCEIFDTIRSIKDLFLVDNLIYDHSFLNLQKAKEFKETLKSYLTENKEYIFELQSEEEINEMKKNEQIF